MVQARRALRSLKPASHVVWGGLLLCRLVFRGDVTTQGLERAKGASFCVLLSLRERVEGQSMGVCWVTFVGSAAMYRADGRGIR